ncbi:MAG: DUF1905 domain-containing protein [Phycisphaeraceae bacterium]|nr:DUF1905 domain-containing protein [Phycisphaeraceae bacterium]
MARRAARRTEAAGTIGFTAALLRPAREAGARAVSWAFVVLPAAASARLPSRGMVSVAGSFGGVPFRATLEPDGEGGHWLKVTRALRDTAGVDVGDVVTLEIAPVPLEEEPEPGVPADLRKALAGASARAREVWSDITPVARRDWIQWITSGKRAETRMKRIAAACDMLGKGKRRACCFDRSGMYGKSLSCPTPEPPISPTGGAMPGAGRRSRGSGR